MSFLVQKYGGTSVGNPERIRNVANRVAESHKAGHRLVIVVSAMSGVTDSLIKLAREVNPEATAREVDVLLSTGEQQTIALLALALHGLGIPAVSLTGAQAGIVTDGRHTKAKISNISPKKVFEYLDSGHVVIVAGFQGQNEEGHITTLGRGGSDLTAIAMAAALKADTCEIYTDVDGVYTADPRLVPNAKKINEISYDEMLVHFLRRDVGDLRLGVHLVGDDAGLRSGERHGRDADAVQRQRGERDGLLLAGGEEHVDLAGAGLGGDLAGELEQVVGHARHGGDDHDQLVPGLVAGGHAGSDVADALGVAHRGAAIFLDDKGHGEGKALRISAKCVR